MADLVRFFVFFGFVFAYFDDFHFAQFAGGVRVARQVARFVIHVFNVRPTGRNCVAQGRNSPGRFFPKLIHRNAASNELVRSECFS